ncbi:CinA family protein [Frondihabitans australicus]|uniref:Nicotinamide-nucleotide amidase n=1 Tax=Frondihabitans australicus TaxID=386892 RepID=A0A495IFR5_9MICO|nr:nicotinamide-nucleotide amidohydrolase family protein [Frondihabitans australicus]RKR74490.1 nicotinamide-nucleotide amidase [Frondihabitans australicus]
MTPASSSSPGSHAAARASSLAHDLVGRLRERGLTIAVAESLTGGLVVASLVDVPGASKVVCGGVVAYQTELKASLLGVSETLLAEHGAVHPDVAASMAMGVRERLTLDGVNADIGLATTGVAGPDPQDGQPVGTVYVGIAWGDDVEVLPLALEGDRSAIRWATVVESLSAVGFMLDGPRE